MKIYSCLYILGVGYHILGSLDSKSLKTLQKKKKKKMSSQKSKTCWKQLNVFII